MFFFCNVDYSVYVIKIALFRISLFLSHLNAKIKIRKLLLGLNKVFFEKKKKKKEKKKGTRLGDDISFPHCLATGIRNSANQKFGSKSGHRAQISRNFVRYDALVMKRFCLLIRIAFANGF